MPRLLSYQRRSVYGLANEKRPPLCVYGCFRFKAVAPIKLAERAAEARAKNEISATTSRRFNGLRFVGVFIFIAIGAIRTFFHFIKCAGCVPNTYLYFISENRNSTAFA